MKNVSIYGERFVHVNWEDTDSLVEPHTCSNVIVGSFVTAQARLKLYEILEKLRSRVLYFDTDSIIYVHKPDKWNPEIGDRLGELTDEVPDARIVKFVGMGPKNYGYEYVEKDGKRKSMCKVKGLTLDYNTSQLIHFHRMLECLFVLRFNVPVNNFSVMSGRSQRFLGLTSTVGSRCALLKDTTR